MNSAFVIMQVMKTAVRIADFSIEDMQAQNDKLRCTLDSRDHQIKLLEEKIHYLLHHRCGSVEIEHRVKMRERIADIIRKEPSLLPELKAGYEYARSSFHKFFVNIYSHIDKELFSGRSSVRLNKVFENSDTIFE